MPFPIFYPESVMHTTECACCGKALNGKVGAMLAVYEQHLVYKRNYFPFIHEVCDSCVSRYEKLWCEMHENTLEESDKDFSGEPLAVEMCKNAPRWSMIRKSLAVGSPFFFLKVDTQDAEYQKNLREFGHLIYECVDTNFWYKTVFNGDDDY